MSLGGQPAIATTCGLGLVVDGLMTESHCSAEQVVSPLGKAEQVECESQLRVWLRCASRDHEGGSEAPASRNPEPYWDSNA